MRKFLPTSYSLGVNSSKGFTLIELMVVVVIIAILSIVGISLFSTAQKNARDGVRRAELTGLGKSIESTKDPNSGNYIYANTLYADDFPQIKAMDPLKDSTKQFYCVATSTGATPTPPPAPTGTWTANCPADLAGTGYTAYAYLVDNAGVYNNTASNSLQSGSVKYWRICTKLEVPTYPSASNPFCVRSNN